MEEWHNGHDQAWIRLSPGTGEKTSLRHRENVSGNWRPLPDKWGIGIGVGMAVMAAMMMAYMKTHYQTQAALEALISDQNKLMAFYEKMLISISTIRHG